MKYTFATSRSIFSGMNVNKRILRMMRIAPKINAAIRVIRRLIA